MDSVSLFEYCTDFVKTQEFKKIPTTKDLIKIILNIKINIEGELISYLFWNFKFWYFEVEEKSPEYFFSVESDYYNKTGIRFFFELLQDRFLTITINDKYKNLSKSEMYNLAVDEFLN